MTEEKNRLREVLLRLQAYLDASLEAELRELRHFVLELLEQIAHDPGSLPVRQAQLLQQLRAYPELAAVVREWLHTAGAATLPTTRGPLPSKDIESALESLSVGADEPTPTVTRYTDIELPAQVQIAQRFPLIVGLTVAPSPDSADAQQFDAPLGAEIQCMVTPGPALEVVNRRMQPLIVAAEDSQPVVFYLRAIAAGDHQLQIDFWYNGQIIASSTQGIQAVDVAVTSQASHRAGPPLVAPAATAPYPDLVIRITTVQNQLRYDLSFGDLNFIDVPGKPLRSDPEQYRYNLLQKIEDLSNEPDTGDGYVLRELIKIGQNLYKELWSEEMRREYRRFRKVVRTIQIISDEPWIPWELIKPYDKEDPADPVDDDFLALKFDLARWFTPATMPPAATILIDSVACIAPSDSGLPAAQQELTLLQQLALQRQLQDYTPATPDKATVEALLTSGEPIRLWHFACHGDFDANAPGQSPLLMQGAAATGAATARSGERPFNLVGSAGTPQNRAASRRHQLRPDDFVGPVTTRLQRDRPFVFLNACRVGSGGLGLTGVGGWAKVLVADCGVGALLAPLWTINDAHAREFAELFYGALAEDSTTIGAATRAARLELRRRHPNDPLWLAYSLYAHPNARIRLTA